MKLINRLIMPFKQLTLPSDSLTQPAITITGNNRISIEQHYTLLSFSDKLIKLQCEEGTIHVNGDSLTIKLMYPREIILEGIIREVIFDF